MTFEARIKSGRHWQYVGTVKAADSRQAARHLHRLYHVRRVQVRPEDSLVNWFTYKFEKP